MSDLISRQAAIDALGERPMVWTDDDEYALGERSQYDIDRLAIETVPSAQPTISCDHENDTSSAQPDADKYEYHYDHTDCIWYRPEARNRCPSTCAQYRDGWNDAMQYIFRDGKGYRPYRRDKKYEHTD